MALYAPVLEKEHIDASLEREMAGKIRDFSALVKLQKNRNVNVSGIGLAEAD